MLAAHHEHAEDAEDELAGEGAGETDLRRVERRPLTADIVDQCARVSAVASAEMPIPITTVRPSVHVVERTERSFVHSLRMRSTIPYRPAGMAAGRIPVWSMVAYPSNAVGIETVHGLVKEQHAGVA